MNSFMCVLVLRFKPLVAMFHDERVVIQVRIGFVDPIDFGELSGSKSFGWIQTPDSFEQALTTEDLMQSCNAPGKSICCIEKCGVGVSHFDGAAEHGH